MTDHPKTDATRLDWALCISTLNRLDALTETVRLALAQSRPPREIVIADAGDEWRRGADAVGAIARDSGVPLQYLHSERRSTAAQRNMAVRAASSDVVFLIDDDSFMFPDCAEEIMKVYEAERGGEIVCVSAASTAESPLSGETTFEALDGFGNRNRGRIVSASRRSPLVAWVLKHLLLMNADDQFLDYDGDGRLSETPLPCPVPDTLPAKLVQGYRLTARRDVVLREPFEDGLEGYAVFEDLDATYRFGWHGRVVISTKGRLHHATVNSGRTKFYAQKLLAISNTAYVTRRHAPDGRGARRRFAVFAFRMILASVLKDLISRRLGFERTRGMIRGAMVAADIFRAPKAGLRDWYSDLQIRVMRGDPV